VRLAGIDPSGVGLVQFTHGFQPGVRANKTSFNRFNGFRSSHDSTCTCLARRWNRWTVRRALGGALAPGWNRV